MCGIIGIVSPEPSHHEQPFADGFAAISPRGRTQNTLSRPGESYGYARLPTDDVTNRDLNGIFAIDDSILLFNGLITNVPELVALFKLPSAAAASDRLCLQHGLLAVGPAFIKKCRGMFALAFITPESVLLTRDSSGIKPLYYLHRKPAFGFASEIKGLLGLNTPICEVEPGHIIRFDKTNQRITDQFFIPTPTTAGSLERDLIASVAKPTRRYLENEPHKPVGLMLSGGLDSSLLAQLLVNNLPRRLHSRLLAFCLGRDYAPDTINAQRLAEHLDVKLIRVQPYSAERSLELLPEIVRLTESPYARVAKVGLLYHALAQAVTDAGIDTIIGGEGADELFFGYQRFIDGVSPTQSKLLFNIFTEHIFPSTLLQRFDRIFAHHLVEGRVPYLDQAVKAHSDRLPPKAKIAHHAGGHTSKLPLRELARQAGLPEYIAGRPKEKMTFGATGLANDSHPLGYLEAESLALTGSTIEELTQLYYRQQFHISGRNPLVVPPGRFTEDALARLAAGYREQHLHNKKGSPV